MHQTIYQRYDTGGIREDFIPFTKRSDTIFGIEAAHIKWKQFYGPCTVDNGLALCSIHHKAFDKGVIGLTGVYKILVSNTLNGGNWSDILFYKFEGNMIYLPENNINLPQQSYIDWHIKEVFRN